MEVGSRGVGWRSLIGGGRAEILVDHDGRLRRREHAPGPEKRRCQSHRQTSIGRRAVQRLETRRRLRRKVSWHPLIQLTTGRRAGLANIDRLKPVPPTFWAARRRAWRPPRAGEWPAWRTR